MPQRRGLGSCGGRATPPFPPHPLLYAPGAGLPGGGCCPAPCAAGLGLPHRAMHRGTTCAAVSAAHLGARSKGLKGAQRGPQGTEGPTPRTWVRIPQAWVAALHYAQQLAEEAVVRSLLTQLEEVKGGGQVDLRQRGGRGGGRLIRLRCGGCMVMRSQAVTMGWRCCRPAPPHQQAVCACSAASRPPRPSVLQQVGADGQGARCRS